MKRPVSFQEVQLDLRRGQIEQTLEVPQAPSAVMGGHLSRLLEGIGWVLAITVLLAELLVGGCSTRGRLPRHDDALRGELLAMCDVDQRVRQGFGSQMSPETVAEMQAVDAKHT